MSAGLEPIDGEGVSAASLDPLCEAIEAGAGLPVLTRTAMACLSASLAVIDRTGVALAVAARTRAEEERLLQNGYGVETIELKVNGQQVGELRWRNHRAVPASPLLRPAATMIGLEVERSRSPEWAEGEAASELVRGILEREITGRDEIVSQASDQGLDLADNPAIVLLARLEPRSAQASDWRARLLTISLRALRSVASGTLVSMSGEDERAEISAIVPAADDDVSAKAAASLERELTAALSGLHLTIAYSRRTSDPTDLYRAGKEAQLAANVAVAEGRSPLAFEDTGSYRLLLGTMSEDPAELERFYQETVAPLVAYDSQYETDLVATVEAYLANDGNIGATAEHMFTHRHTIRYRLDRAKELCGHDITSSDGRERLGLGLKAMRVLGISGRGERDDVRH